MSFTVHKARDQKSLSFPKFQTWSLSEDEIWAEFFREDSNYIVRFPGYADFFISSDGLNVEAWPSKSVDEETLDHLYRNQIQPLALSRQHKLVLHASAVSIDAHAVAFLGASGAGKSTLAVSFALDGNAVLTDDGLELELINGIYHVQPSHPSVRLWKDSEEELVPASVTRTAPVQFTEKLRLLADEEILFEQQVLPLKRLYLLNEEESSEIEISRLAGHTSMIELVKNSFLLDIDVRDMLKHHFLEIAQIIENIPIYNVAYPRNYAALADVRAALRKHLRFAVT